MTATPIAIRRTFRPVSIDPRSIGAVGRVPPPAGSIAVAGRSRSGATRSARASPRMASPRKKPARPKARIKPEHGHDPGEDFEAEEPEEPEQSEHDRNEDRDERDHDEQGEERQEPAQPPAGRRQRTATDRTFGDGHEARGQPQRENADEQDGQEVANRVADEVRRPVERRLRLPDLDVVASADLPGPRVGPGRAGDAPGHVTRDGHLAARDDQVLADRAAGRELDLAAGEDTVLGHRPGHDHLTAGRSDVPTHRAADSDRAPGREDVAVHGAVQRERTAGHDEVALDRAIDGCRARGDVQVGRDRLVGGDTDVAAAAQLAAEVALGQRERDREECEEEGDRGREDESLRAAR